MPEQGALERSANETLERLHTGRTVLFYALSRTHPQFSPREIVNLESRGAPQFMGAFDEIAREIKRLNQQGEKTVIYAGEQTQELLHNLADYDAQATAMGELPDTLPAGQNADFARPARARVFLSAAEAEFLLRI